MAGDRAKQSVMAAAVVLAAAGIARQVRRFVLDPKGDINGNFGPLRSVMSDVKKARRNGRGHLLRGMPRPGVRDAEKRALVTLVASGASDAEVERARAAMVPAPVADRRPHVLKSELTGDERIDEYYWLRDDERKRPDVIQYLDAENAYTKAMMADTVDLQESLFQEMRGRLQEADISAPVRKGQYLYYSRTYEGLQYRSHCRRKVPASQIHRCPSVDDVMDESMDEQVMLDENKESRGHSFFMVGRAVVSPDHRLLAYAVDTVGNERYALHVKDLATNRQVLARPIEGTEGRSLAWASDNRTLFYVTKDKLDRPEKVWRHVVGTEPEQDVCVYHETDGQFYVGVSRSWCGSHVVIHTGSAVTSEERILKADNPTGEFRTVLPRKYGVEYGVAFRDQDLFITIRDDERFNSELLVAPLSDPTSTTVLLPHRADVKLEEVVVAKAHMVAMERIDGLQSATVFDLPPPGQPVRSLHQGRRAEFREPSYELTTGAKGDWDSPVLRLAYTSLTTPASAIDLDMGSMRQVVKKVTPVKGPFDSSHYETSRLWATAPDNTRVPISIVRRKDAPQPAPMLLDAYGAYEIPNDAYFQSNLLSLLDRGVSFGIAHVRGGGEMGRRWYEDGKFKKKTNTFTDLIACAEHLVSSGLTSPSTLCISGRSAGGLTMGATVNMRPDLFRAVIMGVPFVDVLTTMMDPSIPLTEIEWDEWGNPLKDEEYYQLMKSYSPVDNVTPQAYPHILITAGLWDPRVAYWEPAKLCAKLRAAKQGDNLLLMKVDMGAGHFSKSGRFDKLRETALEYAFLLKVLGMKEAKVGQGTKSTA